jgi:hypothetical protein
MMAENLQNDIRMTITLRNNILISKREEMMMSQKQFSEFAEIPMNIYTSFETLRAHPNDSDALYEWAEKLSTFIDMPMSKVFPASLTKIKLNKKVTQVSSDNLAKLSYAPTQTLAIESRDLERHVDGVLKTLPERVSYVLKERFGIGKDEDGKSLADVGKLIGNQSERVRQIEAKGLRMLRHPSRARRLKVFIDDEYIPKTSKKMDELTEKIADFNFEIEARNKLRREAAVEIKEINDTWYRTRRELMKVKGPVDVKKMVENDKLLLVVDNLIQSKLNPIEQEISILERERDRLSSELRKEYGD